MVSPPKNRSSTRRACSASSAASRSSAWSSARRSIDRSPPATSAFVERDAVPRAAALLRVARARPLDQDLAHRVRRDGAEVRAVLPAAGLVLQEAQVGFVDERRRLQRLAGPLAARGSWPRAAAAPGRRSAAATRATADRPRPSGDPLDGDLVHHDRLDRAILPPGRHRADLLDDVEPFDDLAEHGSGGCRGAASDRA